MEPSIVAGDATDFLGLRAVITEAEIELLADEELEVEITVNDGCGREIIASESAVLTL